MRWWGGVSAVLVALAVGAVGPAVADEHVWREQSEKTVEARGIEAIEIINSRGRVDLLPSPDGKLHLSALKIVRVRGRERAEELARGIVVETATHGRQLTVEVVYQKRRSIQIGFWDLFRVDGVTLPRYEVQITCQVPRGLSVSVHESSGDIRSEDIAGPQVLKSTSGDVEVSSPGDRVEASSTSGDVNASGLRQARVRSVSGDIVIRQVAGALRASTTSGGITVTGAQDSLALSSTSGDIRTDSAPHGLEAGTSSGEVTAQGVSGVVKVSTSSGDVRLSVREPLRGIDASTSSGEIRLRLDPAVACVLEMRTSSGALEVTLPMEMRTVSRRSVAGTIRGGKTPVVLHTSSGDITVVSGGE